MKTLAKITLQKAGALYAPAFKKLLIKAFTMKSLYIADLSIKLEFPVWLIHEHLRIFEGCQTDFELHYKIDFGNVPRESSGRKPIILKAYADSFFDDSGFLHIQNFHKSDIPYYTLISRDWSTCTLYIDPLYHRDRKTGDVKDSLFSHIRELFIPSLIQNNGVMLHSASIEYNGRGVLFSAPAGTGKSTHVHLWREKYGVGILDGDVTACRMLDGSPYAYGLPWCGTSGEFMNKRLPLQAVVFLEQSAHNEIRKLDIAEAVVRLYARCFLFLGGEAMTDQVLETLEKLAGSIDCYVLSCRPDFEAVELVKKCLDES